MYACAGGIAIVLQVRSRTFSEEVGGEGITLMVPWADLANHAPAFNSTFCISKDKQR